MGTPDEIIALQKRLKKVNRKYDHADEEIDGLIYDYGELDVITTRIEEIRTNLSEIIKIAAAEHGEFDEDHSPTRNGNSVRSKIVRGCPDCESILSNHGLVELAEEVENLQLARRRLKKLSDRRERIEEEFNGLLEEINDHGQALGLPSFAVRWDEEAGFVGFITKVGPVSNFTINDRVILEEGYFVNYDVTGESARAIFDSSEQLVGHNANGKWKLTGLGKRFIQDSNEQTIVKVRGAFSYDEQVPTTDIVIAHRDEPGARRHVVYDDKGNELLNEHHDPRGTS